MFPHGAITRPLDPLASAPVTEARAVELTAAVTDNVLRRFLTLATARPRKVRTVRMTADS